MVKDIKKHLLKNWLILAPMAGVNDVIFRSICINYGAMTTYTEMLSSKALSYKNPKTNNLLTFADNEKNVVVQIFGHDPKVMGEEAKNIEEKFGNKISYIDINMGCPAKKIIKKGDGAALMTTPKLASDIIKACKSSCSLPISVKFRRGFENNNDTSLKFAEIVEKAGADALCIHGRYAMQFYHGKADINCCKNIKKNTDLPLIWSGDVTSYKKARDIVNNNIADAIMIGRAARGNPWVFSKSKKATIKEKLETAKYHVTEYAKINPRALSHMRKHCMWYVAGMPGASYVRNKFSLCNTTDDYINIINEYSNRLEI